MKKKIESSAKKAARTLNQRREFKKKFEASTIDALRLLMNGCDDEEILNKVGIEKSSLSAIKANLTRGTYSPYVKITGDGTCNF